MATKNLVGKTVIVALSATITSLPTFSQNPRGINYWESQDHKDRRLIFSINSYLQEIDAGSAPVSGRRCTAADGAPFMRMPSDRTAIRPDS
jgi:hypothetical protein